MSDKIRFEFEGTPAQLAAMLGGLIQRFTGSTLDRLGMTQGDPPPYDYAPQSVSAQQPPPPAPAMNPDKEKYGYGEGYTSKDVPDSMMPHGARRANPPTMESLAVDPVYGAGVTVPEGPTSNLASSVPSPEGGLPQASVEGFDFAGLELKDEAWSVWTTFVEAWNVNFDGPVDEEGAPTLEQPDRMKLLQALSRDRWGIYILRWIAHYGSLQGAVYHALFAPPTDEAPTSENLDRADRLSANITQVSHAAYPDIGDFHDHSTRWSRTLRGE